VCAVVLLTLLAFWERTAGLGAGLPHAREADTAIVHYAAYAERPEAGMTSTAYPSTVYPVFLGKLLSRLPGASYTVAAAADAPLRAHLDAAARPYVRARWMIALFSLLAIPCTYLFARNWLERGWSVLAAAFAATSLLALELAVVSKPHGALAGFSALALWTMLRLLRSARFRDYAAAGFATGCAMAALNSGLFLFPSFLLAHVFGWRADRDPRRRIGFLFALATCIAFVLVSYSYVFFRDHGAPLGGGALRLGETTIAWDAWSFGGFRGMWPRMLEHEPVLVVLALSALAFGLVRRVVRTAGRDAAPLSADVIVVGVFVSIWFVLFGMHAPFYARYALPILPILAALAAGSIRGATRFAADRLSFPHAAATFAVAFSALALAFPTYASIHLARLRTREDTFQVAARWIRENVERESESIAIGATLTLPLCSTRAALAAWPLWGTQPWVTYQLELLPDLHAEPEWDLRSLVHRGVLRDHKIDRAEVLTGLERARPRWALVQIPTVNGATQDATRATLRELAGEPRLTIRPDVQGTIPGGFAAEDNEDAFVWRTLARERLGPWIEVYALP
jgi:hypothetical protein